MDAYLINQIFSYGTILADVFIVLFLFSLLYKQKHTNVLVSFVGKNAIVFSFVLSLAGLIGSLIYSEVVGFDPCVLCWIQRLFIYPQVVLFGLALIKKEKIILSYAFVLSVLGGLVALYHTYTQLGGKSLTPCTSEGGACSKLLVLEMGYVTIPTMSLTLFVLLILCYIASRRYESI